MADTPSGRFEVGRQLPHKDSKLTSYEGRDLESGEAVMVAEVRPELFADPSIRGAYEYGLRKVAALDHPGIQRVLSHEVDEGRRMLRFFSPRLDGSTVSLRRTLLDGAVLSEKQAVDIARQLLEALEYAHRAGVVFGNVKPANALVTATLDRVVFMGLPKPPFEFSSLLQAGAYLGQPLYCAPEILAGGPIDARTDVYGVGLILYELCTGRLPTETGFGNLGAIFSDIVHRPAPRASEANPDVTPKLDEVIARAITKAPGERFPTAQAMADALAKVQARPIPLLPRERLWALAKTTLPTPVAQLCAAIEHQVDAVAKLSRCIDLAHVAIQLTASVVIASRLGDKQPALPPGFKGSIVRPSLGHWLEILREGARQAGESSELGRVIFDRAGKPSQAHEAASALVALRNDVRHGATIGVATARRLVEENRTNVERLLAAIVFLRNHDLFVARELNYEDGEYTCEASVLRGAYPGDGRTTLRLARPVTKGRVYLGARDGSTMVDLHPFVISGTCPTCEDDEMFFYESAGADRVHYVSFGKGHVLASEALFSALEKTGVLGVPSQRPG